MDTRYLPHLNDLLDIRDLWELEPCSALISPQRPAAASPLPSRSSGVGQQGFVVEDRCEVPQRLKWRLPAVLTLDGHSVGFTLLASIRRLCPFTGIRCPQAQQMLLNLQEVFKAWTDIEKPSASLQLLLFVPNLLHTAPPESCCI